MSVAEGGEKRQPDSCMFQGPCGWAPQKKKKITLRQKPLEKKKKI